MCCWDGKHDVFGSGCRMSKIGYVQHWLRSAKCILCMGQLMLSR